MKKESILDPRNFESPSLKTVWGDKTVHVIMLQSYLLAQDSKELDRLSCNPEITSMKDFTHVPKRARSQHWPQPEPKRQRGHPVETWGENDLTNWLKSIGLEKHVKKFHENKITGDVLLDLNPGDILEIMGNNATGDMVRVRKGREMLMDSS